MGRAIDIQKAEIIDGYFKSNDPEETGVVIRELSSTWELVDFSTGQAIKKGSGFPRRLLSSFKYANRRLKGKIEEETLLDFVVFDLEENVERVLKEIYEPSVQMIKKSQKKDSGRLANQKELEESLSKEEKTRKILQEKPKEELKWKEGREELKAKGEEAKKSGNLENKTKENIGKMTVRGDGQLDKSIEEPKAIINGITSHKRSEFPLIELNGNPKNKRAKEETREITQNKWDAQAQLEDTEMKINVGSMTQRDNNETQTGRLMKENMEMEKTIPHQEEEEMKTSFEKFLEETVNESSWINSLVGMVEEKGVAMENEQSKSQEGKEEMNPAKNHRKVGGNYAVEEGDRRKREADLEKKENDGFLKNQKEKEALFHSEVKNETEYSQVGILSAGTPHSTPKSSIMGRNGQPIENEREKNQVVKERKEKPELSAKENRPGFELRIGKNGGSDEFLFGKTQCQLPLSANLDEMALAKRNEEKQKDLLSEGRWVHNKSKREENKREKPRTEEDESLGITQGIENKGKTREDETKRTCQDYGRKGATREDGKQDSFTRENTQKLNQKEEVQGIQGNEQRKGKERSQNMGIKQNFSEKWEESKKRDLNEDSAHALGQKSEELEGKKEKELKIPNENEEPNDFFEENPKNEESCKEKSEKREELDEKQKETSNESQFQPEKSLGSVDKDSGNQREELEKANEGFDGRKEGAESSKEAQLKMNEESLTGRTKREIGSGFPKETPKRLDTIENKSMTRSNDEKNQEPKRKSKGNKMKELQSTPMDHSAAELALEKREEKARDEESENQSAENGPRSSQESIQLAEENGRSTLEENKKQPNREIKEDEIQMGSLETKKLQKRNEEKREKDLEFSQQVRVELDFPDLKVGKQKVPMNHGRMIQLETFHSTMNYHEASGIAKKSGPSAPLEPWSWDYQSQRKMMNLGITHDHDHHQKSHQQKNSSKISRDETGILNQEPAMMKHLVHRNVGSNEEKGLALRESEKVEGDGQCQFQSIQSKSPIQKEKHTPNKIEAELVDFLPPLTRESHDKDAESLKMKQNQPTLGLINPSASVALDRNRPPRIETAKMESAIDFKEFRISDSPLLDSIQVLTPKNEEKNPILKGKASDLSPNGISPFQKGSLKLQKSLNPFKNQRKGKKPTRLGGPKSLLKRNTILCEPSENPGALDPKHGFFLLGKMAKAKEETKNSQNAPSSASRILKNALEKIEQRAKYSDLFNKANEELTGDNDEECLNWPEDPQSWFKLGESPLNQNQNESFFGRIEERIQEEPSEELEMNLLFERFKDKVEQREEFKSNFQEKYPGSFYVITPSSLKQGEKSKSPSEMKNSGQKDTKNKEKGSSPSFSKYLNSWETPQKQNKTAENRIQSKPGGKIPESKPQKGSSGFSKKSKCPAQTAVCPVPKSNSKNSKSKSPFSSSKSQSETASPLSKSPTKNLEKPNPTKESAETRKNEPASKEKIPIHHRKCQGVSSETNIELKSKAENQKKAIWWQGKETKRELFGGPLTPESDIKYKRKKSPMVYGFEIQDETPYLL